MAWFGSTAAPAVVRRALAPNASHENQTICHGFDAPSAEADDEGVVGCARGGRAPQPCPCPPVNWPVLFHPAMVALTGSLHGPLSPRVFTQRSQYHTVCPACAPVYSSICGVLEALPR